MALWPAARQAARLVDEHALQQCASIVIIAAAVGPAPDEGAGHAHHAVACLQ